MQEFVREKLRESIKAREGNETAEDLLRSFAHEATLMFKTDELVTSLRSDPFEHLNEIKNDGVQRLCELLRVSDFEKTLTTSGYCKISSTVQIQADAMMKRNGVQKYVELKFDHERDGIQKLGDGTSIWYSIDVSRDDGPSEKLLWVKVFAAGSAPSILPAKFLEEEGGWEDMDEGECEDADEQECKSMEQTESSMKKARLDEDGTPGVERNEEDLPEEDRFTAGMDPDALERFLRWTGLGKMEDVTAFFLLMSFPFYEVEFDLVGFILEAVFGPDDDGDEDDGEE
jgi:hypothetical protein